MAFLEEGAAEAITAPNRPAPTKAMIIVFSCTDAPLNSGHRWQLPAQTALAMRIRSSRNKIFPRLAGDFLISFLEEFMARSSNKAIQNCKIFVAECLPTRATFASQGGRELIKMFAMAI